jgi:hypothetical protein
MKIQTNVSAQAQTTAARRLDKGIDAAHATMTRAQEGILKRGSAQVSAYFAAHSTDPFGADGSTPPPFASCAPTASSAP